MTLSSGQLAFLLALEWIPGPPGMGTLCEANELLEKGHCQTQFSDVGRYMCIVSRPAPLDGIVLNYYLSTYAAT